MMTLRMTLPKTITRALALLAVFLLAMTSCQPPLQGIKLKTDGGVATEAAALCRSCDIDRLPYDVFRRRYVSACYQCGIAFGSSIEHCCMCHEAFTQACHRVARK